MPQFIYPATIERDEEGFYLVKFPDFPFAATDGRTLQEALKEAKDCLQEAIAVCIDDALPIPSPSRQEVGQYSIPLPALMAAKATLHNAVKEMGSKINKSELARRLGIDEREVRRMLDPRNNTKIPRIEQVLESLGWQLVTGWKKRAA